MLLSRLSLLTAIGILPMTLPAASEGFHSGVGYRGYGYAVPNVVYGRGFAQPLIQGDYIGAPFTAVPRPSQLVPTPWSYGTYGVPTVSGIASPQTAAPSLTVIHSQGGRRGRRGTASVPSFVEEVNVSVPRR